MVAKTIVQYASPRITLADWQAGKFNDIDIFEDQLKGWIFDQVDVLRAQKPQDAQHAINAVLSLVTPYFEMITSYLEGADSDRQSTKFLKAGLETVLGPSADKDAIEKFAFNVRNGIFHELIFRAVLLHIKGPGLPSFGIETTYGTLAVDPFWLADQVRTHFEGYVRRLRNPQTSDDRAVLANFQKFIALRKTRT